MRPRLSRSALRIVGWLSLAAALLAMLTAAFGLYVLAHNAYYTCDAEPRPPGARPFEAGYAGEGTVAFPVAGVECVWNAEAGGTFRTVIPDPGTTASVWAAVVAGVLGFGVLVGAE